MRRVQGLSPLREMCFRVTQSRARVVAGGAKGAAGGLRPVNATNGRSDVASHTRSVCSVRRYVAPVRQVDWSTCLRPSVALDKARSGFAAATLGRTPLA